MKNRRKVNLGGRKVQITIPTKCEFDILPAVPAYLHSYPDIITMKRDQCRWINEDGSFCGEKTIGTSSYCAEHKKIATRPPKQKTQKNLVNKNNNL